MFPLISVIVPIYNTELYLDKCITSILNQTYQNLEVILVNDGSTDASASICDKYSIKDARVKVIHKQNGGQSSARNMGLDICSGDYIGFIDSDDWISETMYEKMFSLVKNDRMIIAIGSQEIAEDGKITSTRNYEEANLSSEEMLSNILLSKVGCSVCTKLFPRHIIESLRFKENKLNEDLLFMIDVLSNINQISYSSEIGYFCLKRSGSTTQVFGKAVHDMIENAKNVRHYVDTVYPSLSKKAERFEIYQNMSFLLCCPPKYDRDSDPLYKDVLSYVKKHRIKGLFNQYFSIKDKLKLLGVSFSPIMMARIVDYKKKNKNGKNNE